MGVADDNEVGTHRDGISALGSERGRTRIVDGYELSYGFADGDAGFAMGAASAGGADPTNTTRRVALAPISIVQPGEVIDSEATVIAWDATTFTLRWDFNRSTPAVVPSTFSVFG